MRNLIRYKGFKGFFIMKKGDDGRWEYLSSYWRKGKTYRLSFSDTEVRYFSDSTIENGTAWIAFSCVRHEFPDSQIIMYVNIDGNMERVRWYNPTAENKMTVWHRREDYFGFIPKEDMTRR